MDGVSIAASLVGIGAAGCQIAIKLYTLATQISTAPDRITSISNDVSLTSGVLQQLGELMTQKATHEGTSIFSHGGLETTKASALMCERIFKEIEQAAKDASQQIRGRGPMMGGKLKLSKSERIKWPFLQPSIETLRIDLREAKGTLMLMLQVTSLAFSKKMADIHQTASTNIIEQREIIAAILAIQKQQRRPQEPLRQSSPVDRAGNSTPIGAPPIGPIERSISLDEASTLAPTPSSSSLASLPIRPNVLMALPTPNTRASLSPKKIAPNNCGDGCEPSRDSAENSQEGCNSRILPFQSRSSHHEQRMLPIRADKDGESGDSRLLDLFLMRPVIEDIEDTIQLSWRIHKVQMQQAEIQNQISQNEREGLPPVFEVYQDLYGHEYKAIELKISEFAVKRSLVALKRIHMDMRHRGIFFQGIPGLQFVLQQGEQRPLLSQPEQDHVPKLPVSTGDTQEMQDRKTPKAKKFAKKLAFGDFLDDSSLGTWADDMDDVPLQNQRPSKEVSTLHRQPDDFPPSLWDQELANMDIPSNYQDNLGLEKIEIIRRDDRRRDDNVPSQTHVAQVRERTLRRKKKNSLFLNANPGQFLTSLQNARSALSYKIIYPTGITPPRSTTNDRARSLMYRIIRYDVFFLLQFKNLVRHTLAIADIDRLVCKPNELAVDSQMRRRLEHPILPLDRGVESASQTKSRNDLPILYGYQEQEARRPALADQKPQPLEPFGRHVRTAADIMQERRDRETAKKAEARNSRNSAGLMYGASSARDRGSIDKTTNIRHSVQEEPDVELFKSHRAPTDESCSRTLIRLLQQYNLPGEWHEYDLYILHGSQERRVDLVEKPLALFSRLEQEGKKPAFELRKHAAVVEKSPEPPAAGIYTVRKRTKTGCLTCRRRRIKCDERLPTCSNCFQSQRSCEGYSQRVIYKDPLYAPNPDELKTAAASTAMNPGYTHMTTESALQLPSRKKPVTHYYDKDEGYGPESAEQYDIPGEAGSEDLDSPLTREEIETMPIGSLVPYNSNAATRVAEEKRKRNATSGRRFRKRRERRERAGIITEEKGGKVDVQYHKDDRWRPQSSTWKSERSSHFSQDTEIGHSAGGLLSMLEMIDDSGDAPGRCAVSGNKQKEKEALEKLKILESKDDEDSHDGPPEGVAPDSWAVSRDKENEEDLENLSPLSSPDDDSHDGPPERFVSNNDFTADIRRIQERERLLRGRASPPISRSTERDTTAGAFIPEEEGVPILEKEEDDENRGNEREGVEELSEEEAEAEAEGKYGDVDAEVDEVVEEEEGESEEEVEAEGWETQEAERIVEELLGKYTTLFDTQTGVPGGVL
ncbi:MAG: hypothetical protein Q9220_007594 [cf. Caloplaca sp. 1 TL-2023]